MSKRDFSRRTQTNRNITVRPIKMINNWKTDPATEKQMSYILYLCKKYGCVTPDCQMSKRAASDMISRLLKYGT